MEKQGVSECRDTGKPEDWWLKFHLHRREGNVARCGCNLSGIVDDYDGDRLGCRHRKECDSMGFARGLEMDMSQRGYSPVFSLIVLFGGSVRERASPCAWWLGEKRDKARGRDLDCEATSVLCFF